MKQIRIHILGVLALLLVGIAAFVHTAIQQTQAHTASGNAIRLERITIPSQEQMAELAAAATSGKNSDAGAPVPPTPPAAPIPPAPTVVSVDLPLWIMLTAAIFTPFALVGWYLAHRSRATVYEQPLA